MSLSSNLDLLRAAIRATPGVTLEHENVMPNYADLHVRFPGDRASRFVVGATGEVRYSRSWRREPRYVVLHQTSYYATTLARLVKEAQAVERAMARFNTPAPVLA